MQSCQEGHDAQVMRAVQYSAQFRGGYIGFELFTTKVNTGLDSEFQRPIIRTTSGAVETENSLSFNELDGFDDASFKSSKQEMRC